jgi:hypothetical protein
MKVGSGSVGAIETEALARQPARSTQPEQIAHPALNGSWFVPMSSGNSLPRAGGHMSDRDRDTPAPRDRRECYVKGASRHPTGKPRGCLNHAGRIAARLRTGAGITAAGSDEFRCKSTSNKINDRFETEAACGVPKDATTIARIFAADFLQMQQTIRPGPTRRCAGVRSGLI